jgi:hypothetical protein
VENSSPRPSLPVGYLEGKWLLAQRSTVRPEECNEA